MSGHHCSEGQELALHAALNVLRDSVECGRMPSGVALGAEALAMHEAAITECERLLAQRQAALSGWHERHSRRS